MKFELYGKQLEFADAQIGMYKSNGLYDDYAVMDMGLLVNGVASWPKEKTIKGLKQLKAAVEGQLASGPQTFHSPVLRGPGSIPLSEVRSYLQNTVSFCDYLLKELE